MLLNYLYTHYYEHGEYCTAAGLDVATMARLEAANIVPKASYIVDIDLRAKSFVAAHNEAQTYRFYLKGQLEWLAQIDELKITTETAAQHYFETQYNKAIAGFLDTELGRNIVAIFPQSSWSLGDYSETWQHFIDGTYGLCTRTGLPKEIFLKHVYIRFIVFITAANQPQDISPKFRKLLLAVVDDLDLNVESDFAAHEVEQSSRQRCIIDVRNVYEIK